MEMMLNGLLNDEKQLQEIFDMELVTSKNMNVNVYPEAWWEGSTVSDSGNQEYCSWQVYAMGVFFRINKNINYGHFTRID